MKNCVSSEQLLSKPFLANNIDRELAERNLRDFVRLAWPVVEPSTPFVDGWHVDAITDHLQAITRGEIRNLLINVPPRHMKSLRFLCFGHAGNGCAFRSDAGYLAATRRL